MRRRAALGFRRLLILGASISSCTFVDCTFTSTVFAPNDEGIRTTFEGSRWFGCTQVDCKGLEEQFGQ